MTRSQLKVILPILNEVVFKSDIRNTVSAHLQVTEVEKVSRQFIDCLGNLQNSSIVNAERCNANDTSHRLKPSILIDFIKQPNQKLRRSDEDDLEECRCETIGRSCFVFEGSCFMLQYNATGCLASDLCVIPLEKLRCKLSKPIVPLGSCIPNSAFSS